MRFLLRRLSSLDDQHKANGTAIAIALGAVVFLQFESPPRPAGADSTRLVATKTAPVMVMVQKQQLAPEDEQQSPEQLAERSLRKKISFLERGLELLRNTPDYTAQFAKQELVNGELLEEQTMLMKVRHAPFSVYLKWIDYDTGREVLYVDGLNDGQMLVHAGGWKARLPAMLVSPNSSLALKETRHPITQAGLLNLAETIVTHHREDLELKNYKSCEQMADQGIGGRDCWCFVVEYRDRATAREYRKSLTLIDKEWSVPLFIKNFGWPDDETAQSDEELDAATLVEQYTYVDVKFRSALTALDFDRVNEDYGFKRQ
jgi:hypothetical protein